ncbi:MAG: Pyridoxal-5'-phosphate-dependent protein beta subunit [Mesotoga prima]|uniref:Pyridoxal-5'-phosphate-dependent protein beta subunit n=1 Tax=Mesotoga prima TaxID=1184387 RepID=A0A101HQN7_9BACT|nr:MAG: Pyridoxal-5'-phosphate-dependent protein beta subunit [Mesotoga prima]
MPCPLDGHLALEAIFSSNGFALSVSDEEMVKAVKLLAKYEGLFAEPTGAASVAGFIKAHRAGIVGKGYSAVAIITGTGLKTISAFKSVLAHSKIVGRDSSELKRAIDEN